MMIRGFHSFSWTLCSLLSVAVACMLIQNVMSTTTTTASPTTAADTTTADASTADATTASVTLGSTVTTGRPRRPRPPRIQDLLRCLRFFPNFGRVWRCITDAFRQANGGGRDFSLGNFKMSFWDVLKIQKLQRKRNGSDQKYMQKLLDRSG